MTRISLQYSADQLGMQIIPASLADHLIDGEVPIRWGQDEEQVTMGTIVGVQVDEDGQGIEFTVETKEKIPITKNLAARQLLTGFKIG